MMKTETVYTVTYGAAKRTAWPPSESSSVYYVVRYGCKKVVEVWARNGEVRKFYQNGKRAQLPADYIPKTVQEIESCARHIAFFLLTHAFDHETAVNWHQVVTDNFEFHRDYRTPYTKSELFGLILDSRQRSVHATSTVSA